MCQICMHCAKLYPGQTCFPVLCSLWPLLPDTFASRAPPVSAYNGLHFLRDKGHFNQITAAIFTCMYTVYLQTHPSFCRFVKMAHPSHRGSTSFVSSSVSNIAWHYHTSLGLTELHACTTSMRWGLKDSTYCSSSSSSLASMETRAIRRAESCVQGREASHNIYNLALFTVVHITVGKTSEPGAQNDETIHPIVA